MFVIAGETGDDLREIRDVFEFSLKGNCRPNWCGELLYQRSSVDPGSVQVDTWPAAALPQLDANASIQAG